MTVRHADIRAAMELLGGPSEMARIWGINVRNSGKYFSGARELPPKRLFQLIEALRLKAAEAKQIADALVMQSGPFLKVAAFDGQTIKPLSEKEP
jgi:hypothetical protein